MATLPDLSGLPSELLQELLFGGERLRILQQQRRPVREHLADYCAALNAAGDKARHVRDTIRRVRTMLRLCRATTFAAIQPHVVRLGLVKLRTERPRRKMRGLATVNHYLSSLKGFCNWMVANDRADRSPCRGIKPFPAQTDVRRRRRALTPDEVLRLVSAANAAGPVAGIPGAERAMTYLLACTTGLRAGEIESLGRQSFRLDDGNPRLVVRASYTKGKRDATIPLRADVAELLKAFLRENDRPSKLFRRPSGNGVRGLRADLKAAGIPYELSGEFADFHALRHTFVSHLFDSGATPKEAQTLARHQDARLTLGRYAHVAASAQRTAVERLSSIVPVVLRPVAESGAAESRA